MTANITIHYSTSSSFSATGCGNYTLPWGTVVTISGDYTHHYSTTFSCDSLVTAHITIDTISASTSKTNVTCNGANNGSITITAIGAIGTVFYSDNGGSTYQSSNVFNNLPPANYMIVVKDDYCTSTPLSGMITQPSVISVSTSKTNVTCNGSNNGSITVTANGGTGTLVYSDDGGSSYQPGNVFTNLAASSYSIVVKDANGCTSTPKSVNITQPSAISVSTSQVNVTCNGNNNGSITVFASGGTGILKYSDNGGSTYQNSNVFNNLPAAAYSVVVKDANGCTSTPKTVTITQPSAISASASQTNVTCNGGNNGSITVTASGGTGTLKYSDNGGSSYQNGNTFNNLIAGTYSIVVKDANGCTSAPKPVTITQPSPFTASITQSGLSGFCQGPVVVLIANATGVVSYLWSTGETTSSISVGTSGMYSVTVKNAAGCSASASTNVTIYNSAFLSSYTIISKTKVNIDDHSTVSNGGVGTVNSNGIANIDGSSIVTGVSTFVKSAAINVTNGSSVSTKIMTPTGFPLPVFQTNPYCSSTNHQTIANNATVTLSDSVYGNISIGKNATVIFSKKKVYAVSITVGDGAVIKFSQCTEMRVCIGVTLGNNDRFNTSNTQQVTMYVGGNFSVQSGSTITSTIYTQGNLQAFGTAAKPTAMNGLFMGVGEVDGQHYVTFNWRTVCSCVSSKETEALAGDSTTSGYSMNLFPNPTDGRFTINLNLHQDVSGTATVIIINAIGQVAYHNEVGIADGLLTKEINLNDAEGTGLYVVRIIYGERIFTKQLILQR